MIRGVPPKRGAQPAAPPVAQPAALAQAHQRHPTAAPEPRAAQASQRRRPGELLAEKAAAAAKRQASPSAPPPRPKKRPTLDVSGVIDRIVDWQLSNDV
jgi:hypothetical protein